MAWWNIGRRKRETVTTSWLGEKLAEGFYPAQTLQMVGGWHHLPADSPMPFLALASLHVAGVRIGCNQESIMRRVDQHIIVKVHHSLVAALVDKYANAHKPEPEPRALIPRLFDVANRVTDAFYTNANSKPPLPLPHWYAGKELCLFLLNGKGVPNPEEVMTYAEYLSVSIRATKQFLDGLLAADVALIE